MITAFESFNIERQKYSNYTTVNEGIGAKTFLAIALTLSSIFTNVGNVLASSGASPYVYKTEKEWPVLDPSTNTFDNEVVHKNLSGILHNLYALQDYIKDPRIKDLYDELNKLYQQDEEMGLEEFVQRFNIIRPKLLALVKEYGMENYKLEQIANHISRKDYKKVYADIRYLKYAIDQIAKKHNVTRWDTVYGQDVFAYCVICFMGLFLVGVVGFIMWDNFGYTIKNSIREAREGIRRKLYRKLYYKKHSDVDPYGEEEWWN